MRAADRGHVAAAPRRRKWVPATRFPSGDSQQSLRWLRRQRKVRRRERRVRRHLGASSKSRLLRDTPMTPHLEAIHIIRRDRRQKCLSHSGPHFIASSSAICCTFSCLARFNPSISSGGDSPQFMEYGIGTGMISGCLMQSCRLGRGLGCGNLIKGPLHARTMTNVSYVQNSL